MLKSKSMYNGLIGMVLGFLYATYRQDTSQPTPMCATTKDSSHIIVNTREIKINNQKLNDLASDAIRNSNSNNATTNSVNVDSLLKQPTSANPSANPTADTDPQPVKPKASQFNYDFRPYFVYSELGFRYNLIVGVVTTERRLNNFAVAINNTWSHKLAKVLFFVPYSKNSDFHEKYNRNLNLNVVQLPDISDDSTPTEMSFRMLQYLRDHYQDNYNWFMQVSDNVYINSEKLINFLNSLNSSADYYIGHPTTYQDGVAGSNEPTEQAVKHTETYCFGASGVILSRSAIIKLVSGMNSCRQKINYNNDNNIDARGRKNEPSNKNNQEQESADIELAKCISKTCGVSCPNNVELQELFHLSDEPITNKVLMEKPALIYKTAVIYPIATAPVMLRLHKSYVMNSLRNTYATVHQLQENIKEMQPTIPAECEDKTLHWPVGFTAPFKPRTRFEVIPWTYFTEDHLYGHSDVSPVSEYSLAERKDISDVLYNVRKVASKKTGEGKLQVMNGYKRLDPKRGEEYIVDIKKEGTDEKVHRFHLLRPFTKVEAILMPAATEQRGIHLVLPVTRYDVDRFESFLQMYKRTCLQTGENVVLLTVFINIRGDEEEKHFEGEGSKNDPFIESKNLIARYKHSYMWAQLPWLQVGVKHPSQVLIMDIVSMKLPSSSLIFLVSLSVEFTINFLNRCRVNVISDIQVFFPIPFAEYNPDVVYKNKLKPTFVDIHVTTGAWDQDSDDLACFSNNDYKELRMHQDNFLSEDQESVDSVNQKPDSASTLLDVFQGSKLQIFRALDSELRRKYTPEQCVRGANATAYSACTQHAGKRFASRKELAQLVLENNLEKSGENLDGWAL